MNSISKKINKDSYAKQRLASVYRNKLYACDGMTVRIDPIKTSWGFFNDDSYDNAELDISTNIHYTLNGESWHEQISKTVLVYQRDSITMLCRDYTQFSVSFKTVQYFQNLYIDAIIEGVAYAVMKIDLSEKKRMFFPRKNNIINIVD